MTKVVAFGCAHNPLTRPEAWASLTKLVRAEKPDVIVNLGDWFDADGASVHPEEHDWTLEDEYEAAANQSKELRQIVKGKVVRLIWCLGNHDDNIQTRDPRRVPKKLRSLVHWNASKFADEFQKWRQIPYTKAAAGHYKLGPIVFFHGYDCGVTSDETEAVQMALHAGARPGLLMVRAHTHSPIEPRQVMWNNSTPMPWHYANVGTLGPLKPRYAQRRNTMMWGAAALVATIERGAKWTAEIQRF